MPYKIYLSRDRRDVMKNNKGKHFWPAILIGALLASGETYAATAFIGGAKINRLMAHHEKFGLCMAQLNKKNNSLSCSEWVTFDCNGEFDGNSKTAANNMFNLAQLALVTGKTVRVAVDDTKKINGQCFATRIEAFR